MAVVLVIKAQTSRDKSMMHLLCCPHFICAIHDIRLRATHVAGKVNICTDAISRNYLQALTRHCHNVDLAPSITPPSLWYFTVHQMPGIAHH